MRRLSRRLERVGTELDANDVKAGASRFHDVARKFVSRIFNVSITAMAAVSGMLTAAGSTPKGDTEVSGSLLSKPCQPCVEQFLRS